MLSLLPVPKHYLTPFSTGEKKTCKQDISAIFLGHVLKPETTKRNHRNETTETSETTETKPPKRPKRAKRNDRNHRNERNETTETNNRFGRFGGFARFVSLVSVVSFRWFRFVVSGFSTCHVLVRVPFLSEPCQKFYVV